MGSRSLTSGDALTPVWLSNSQILVLTRVLEENKMRYEAEDREAKILKRNEELRRVQISKYPTSVQPDTSYPTLAPSPLRIYCDNKDGSYKETGKYWNQFGKLAWSAASVDVVPNQGVADCINSYLTRVRGD